MTDVNMGHCSEHGHTEFWPDDPKYRGKKNTCKKCEQKRVAPFNERWNPMSNAISQVMHQRMVDNMGIPRKEHYDGVHKALRKRLRREIEADGSWQQRPMEPNKEAPLPPAPARPSIKVAHEGVGLTEKLRESRNVGPGTDKKAMNLGWRYIYILVPDPFHWPDAIRVGSTFEAPDSYIVSRYRSRLDPRHPNAGNLYFLLIYKVPNDGYDYEQLALDELREIGLGVEKQELVIFEDVVKALDNFSGLMSVFGAERVFDATNGMNRGL